jgi:hypothetical protein
VGFINARRPVIDLESAKITRNLASSFAGKRKPVAILVQTNAILRLPARKTGLVYIRSSSLATVSGLSRRQSAMPANIPRATRQRISSATKSARDSRETENLLLLSISIKRHTRTTISLMKERP